MAASNVDNAGGSIDNASKGNNRDAIGNSYSNSGSIVNGNSGTIIGNGSATHHNYGGTVHNMFIVLNICPGSGDGDQDQDSAAAPMVVRVLGLIGVATSSIATGAAAYKYNRPPRGVVNRARELGYFVGIGVVFLAGLAEVGAAFWVSADNRNRYGASRKIMGAAIVVLVLAVGLGGFGIVFNK